MNQLWPSDEPFDQGARQGYADYLAGKVDDFDGDEEYMEGYAEGVDQAKTDRQNGRA